MSAVVELGEVVSFTGGGTPDRSNPDFWDGEIPWATVKDFKNGTRLEKPSESITQLGVDSSATNLIPQGTLIIPTRMALGKAAISTMDMAINQDLKAVIPASSLDVRYLLWYFIAHSQKIDAMGKGATVKGITLDQLRKLKLPLPPLLEQRRIAAILDKAEALRTKRREAIAKLDQLLQSVFLEMFGDPVENPHKLPIEPLAALIEKDRPITYGILKPGVDTVDGIPYIKVMDMRDGKILENQLKRTSLDIDAEYKRSKLKAGDILLSIRGHVGRLAKVPKGLDGANITQDTARLSISSNCESLFILQALAMPAVQRHMAIFTRGAAIKGINLKDVREIPLPVPSISAQKVFAEISKKVAKQRDFFEQQLLQSNLMHKSLKKSFF